MRHRRPLLIAAAGVALLVVATVLWGFSRPAGAGSATAVSIRAPFPKGIVATTPDSGSRTDLEAVRSAVVAIKTDENRAFIIDRRFRGMPVAEVQAALQGPSEDRPRVALMARGRSAALASDLHDSWLHYLRQDLPVGDAAFRDREVWSTSAFHVDRWQGVRVEGDYARVVVRGEDRGTSWSGAAKVDAWAQYHLILQRSASDPDGWRLIRWSASSTAA